MKQTLLLALLATGCPDQSVNGTLRVHWLSESNGDMVENPMPNVTAIVGPDPTQMFKSTRGDNPNPGTWTIGDADGRPLPAGPLYVELGPYYDATEHRTIDFDSYTFGHSGFQAAVAPTTVTLQIDGLEPWAAADHIELFSLDAPAQFFNLERRAMTPPDAGATSAALTFEWATGTQGVLYDGYQTYLVQLAERTNDGLAYTTVSKALKTSALNINNGNTTMLTAMLEDVPATTSLPLELDADEFATFASQVHPRAAFRTALLAVAPKPGGAAIPFPLALGLPDVLLVEAQTNVAGTALIGNPYPSTWTLVGILQASYEVEYTAPGALSPATLSATVEVDHLAIDMRPYRPEIGPVQHPQIEHKDAFGDLMGIGLTPLVTWDPPKLGDAAGGYQITIWEIANVAGATTFKWTAQVLTSSRSVKIPPNVLMLGKAYVFEITAVAAEHDIEQQPLQLSVPNAFSNVLTGLLLP